MLEKQKVAENSSDYHKYI